MHPGAWYGEPAEVSLHSSGRSRYPIQQSRSAKLELAGVDKDIQGCPPTSMRSAGLDAHRTGLGLATAALDRLSKIFRRFIFPLKELILHDYSRPAVDSALDLPVTSSSC